MDDSVFVGFACHIDFRNGIFKFCRVKKTGGAEDAKKWRKIVDHIRIGPAMDSSHSLAEPPVIIPERGRRMMLHPGFGKGRR